MGLKNILKEMSEIKKVLSYSQNIGFFFGAGTSCSVGLPNVINLTTAVEGKFLANDKADFLRIKSVVASLYPEIEVSVEDILNFIRQIRDLTKEKEDKQYEGVNGKLAAKLDNEICKAIFKVLVEAEHSADITHFKKFFAWLDLTSRNNSKEIFTTNYDMILEKAMEANYIPYFDGFVGSYEPFFWPDSIAKFVSKSDLTHNWIRLWKLHGSLNWAWVNDAATNTAKIIRKGKTDTPINELVIYPSKEKYNLSRKQPFIAYFDRLKNYLLNGETLLIFSGYSFMDEHINELIFNCLRLNPRLYSIILCYDDIQVEFMEKYAASYLNMCVMGPKKAIINGDIGEWEYNTDFADEENSDLYWDDTKKQFLLGDFTKLVDFLAKTSGKSTSIEEIINGK